MKRLVSLSPVTPSEAMAASPWPFLQVHADRAACDIVARKSGGNMPFGNMQWTARGGTELYTLPV